MAISSPAEATVVGSGEFRYRAVPGWERLPEGWSFVEAVGAATDSQDRLYVFNRGEHPVIVFDRSGEFLHAWGEGLFKRPHGIFIGPDDSLYNSDDHDHTVRKFTPEGELLLTLGKSGVASDTGIDGIDYRSIRRPAGPFNLPTNLALAPDGTMYVSDGYGNARVHKFSADGQLLLSWGGPGAGPGQFNLPHGIGVDSQGRVFVADRENSRLQLFSPDGAFLAEWTDMVRPCDVYIDRQDRVFVAELGRRVGGFPWMTPDPHGQGSRVSIFDAQGKLLSRFGGGERPCTPGDFLALHDIWVDTQGSIYTSEVIVSAAGKSGLLRPGSATLQKFVRA